VAAARFGSVAAAPIRGARASAGFGQGLPDDAAPPDQQIWRRATDPTIAKVLDFYEQVYERPTPADLFSDPLVRLTKDFEIVPAAALEWSGSEDGRTWAFRLDPALVWSDESPVTANDWVATFRYAADPAHAWDFAWYWTGVIRGFGEALEGAPLDQIGVRQGATPQELIFETVEPAPFLPSMLLYSQPLSAAALERSGPLYNTNPETAVSSGPFILREWARDQYILYERNESYRGSLQAPIQRVVAKLAAPNTHFTLYEAGEIDFMDNPAPAELQIMQADPELAKQIYQGVGDFRVDYLFFDVSKPPFDNLQVRRAFSHVVDREAIKQQILGPIGNPAYSFLAPGFPASNMDALADVQRFDPELGKQLFTEAGFPNGEGFPGLELWLRAPTPVDSAVAGAVASMLKQHLNVDVEISAKDQKLFTDAMNAKPTEIQFGYVSYGMDYLDPSNMLGLWLSGGRHPWSNPNYDAMVREATTFLGDPAQRVALFQEGERILVEDVPAVFVYYRTPVQFIKPYVKGTALEPDRNGVAAIHWPEYATTSTVPGEIYIGNDAPPGRDVL
ncbi:MAG: peptide ABC transporter substrate-binding protein, partial [Chloroflexota bacterium]|nr:peptide ABC transporter substrate-binding protein [Chloroflexota bacterium]